METLVFLPTLVILGMFGLGTNLTVDEFKPILVHPKVILVGLSNQLLFVSLTSLFLALVLPFSPE